MKETEARLQQSKDAKYEFIKNTRDIKAAPKRIRHSKRLLKAAVRTLTNKQTKNKHYRERQKQWKLLEELLETEEEDEESPTFSMESDEEMENNEDMTSKCNKDQDSPQRKPLLEIKQIDIDKLSVSTEEEVLLVFQELGLRPPACSANERGTKKYFTVLITLLKYHRENYYKDMKTPIPHNNIKNLKKDLDENFCQQLFEFENTMFNIHSKHCSICHQRRLNIVTKDGMCGRCRGEHFQNKFTHANNALPVWVDSETKQVHYEAPKELKDLSIAEKLLIQKVSPLVPVIHIKNGVMACRGHCCSFFQDISTVCKVFPRLPAEVTMVKVIRTSTTKEGNIVDRAFTVNRRKVLSALIWLKKHNHLYDDIEIKQNRLNWMEGQSECSLADVITIEAEEIEEDEENDR